ncbi:MAG: hypothetical protein KGI82_00575 [Betaproteobacteria bacterium]|nr:hypothetical protein [Betaproteobacteria bacterium]
MSDAMEQFETLAALYYERFGRLPPGKDDALYDSPEESNVRRFIEWQHGLALTDALPKIVALQQQVLDLTQQIDELQEQRE